MISSRAQSTRSKRLFEDDEGGEGVGTLDQRGAWNFSEGWGRGDDKEHEIIFLFTAGRSAQPIWSDAHFPVLRTSTSA